MTKFRGAFTAMITPMLADGSVDFEGFRKNVKFQLEQGIDVWRVEATQKGEFPVA